MGKSILVALVLLFTIEGLSFAAVSYEIGIIYYGDKVSNLKINDSGQIAGSVRYGDGLWRATLFENGVMTDIGSLGTSPGHEISVARGINNLGQVVGYSETDIMPGWATHGFLYDNGVLTDLGGGLGGVMGINDVGQILLGQGVYEDGVFTPLGTSPLGGGVSGNYINNNSQVVGLTWDGVPFLWENGTFTLLDTLSGTDFNSVQDINNNGQVIGNARFIDDSPNHGVLWENGVLTDLGAVQVGAINDSGQIVGDFFWEDGIKTLFEDLLLETSGWDFRHMYGVDINNNGWIVGTGYYNGTNYGFIMAPEGELPDYYAPPTTMPKTLLLLSPNGGELIFAESIHSILWSTDESIENVLLEYSTDNGDTWEVIETVANTGSYDWLVPVVESSECLVRISDSLYPIFSDTSDAVFKISIVYFADEILQAAVEAELGIENPNTNDMLALTRLNAERLGITDLTGLEYAENVSILYLHSNAITDFAPISELPNLTYVHLAINQIEVIPDISSWTKINYLYLYNNQISDITPLTSAEITTLRNLYIYNNETLPIEAYTDYIPTIQANNPKLTNFRYDLGCEPMFAGDLNNDCAVNLADMAIVAADWLRCSHIYQELCP